MYPLHRSGVENVPKNQVVSYFAMERAQRTGKVVFARDGAGKQCVCESENVVSENAEHGCVHVAHVAHCRVAQKTHIQRMRQVSNA